MQHQKGFSLVSNSNLVIVIVKLLIKIIRKLGDDIINIENRISVSVNSEDFQHKMLFGFVDNPFKPKSRNDIYTELEESRAAYERGEYEDFDKVLDEICEKYGI